MSTNFLETKLRGGRWISSRANYKLEHYRCWDVGDVLTVKINRNDHKVTFYRNDEEWESKTIAQNVAYFFGLVVCDCD